MNNVTIVGRLTKDPVLHKTNSGKPVTTVFVACNRTYASTDGQQADYPPVTLWGKAAENLVKYCRKGSLVGIKGHLKTKYEKKPDATGVWSMIVTAENIEYLGKKATDIASPAHDDIEIAELEDTDLTVDQQMAAYMEELQGAIPQD